MERGVLEEWMTLRLYSDCGPHFRSFRMLGACATSLAMHGRCHIQLCYGLEAYMKGRIDGMMGNNVGTLRGWSKQPDACISDSATCVKILSDDFAVRSQFSAAMPKDEYVDWMPSCSKAEALRRAPKIAANSLPAGLKACHLWQVRLQDRRTKKMCNDELKITGAKVRCVPLPGVAFPSVGVNPTLELQDVELDEAEAGDDEEGEAQDFATKASLVHVNVMEWRGWKVSYRRSNPEDYNVLEPKVRVRLGFKLRSFKHVMEKLRAGKRHGYVSSKKSSGAVRKGMHAKERTQFFANRRRRA
mmetsp:Transcript_92221/g.269876  ORF Transcript_92221/g.269876 Transcript_92221/m.269876 type:complete len:301 (+) Transcript_92221:1516-2418(+)